MFVPWYQYVSGTRDGPYQAILPQRYCNSSSSSGSSNDARLLAALRHISSKVTERDQSTPDLYTPCLLLLAPGFCRWV